MRKITYTDLSLAYRAAHLDGPERAERAERLILAAARSWYAATIRAEKHPTASGLAAAHAARERLFARLVVACGLDRMARRALQRARHRYPEVERAAEAAGVIAPRKTPSGAA